MRAGEHKRYNEMKQDYSPDILNCLANLSSDEVFTSPELANRMLDLLPQELFSSPKTRFLDPCAKSGVFLREIAKRLLAGLEAKIPDLQKRIDHIMTRQVFGIACTDLTAEMSRRTLYCSKLANGEYSVTTVFHDQQGNLLYERCHHTWNAQGRCEHCGASKGEYLRTDIRETYAYPFIHKSIKEIFHKDMQFDVIIGNPPYQLSTGGSKAQAIPIYHKFFLQAKLLNPHFICMITPSKWFSGGFALDDFRDEMINDVRIKHLEDYFDSTDCFGPAVQIKGGVSFFLWDSHYDGKCTIVTHNAGVVLSSKRYLKEDGCEVFIRYSEGVSILNKVKAFKEPSFDRLVSGGKPFGLPTTYHGKEERTSKTPVLVYERTGKSYAAMNEIIRNQSAIEKYKVFISGAYGAGEGFPHQIINRPFFGEKGECCTETFLMVGPFEMKEEANNVMSYMRTKFMRFMVMLKKASQHTMRIVYQLVPMQDFSHPWTDEMLYKKYSLTQDEIAFIESMIRPME